MVGVTDGRAAETQADSADPRAGVLVDAVVVSYNNREHLQENVARLSSLEWVRAVVVDNHSTDGTADTVAHLPARVIRRDENAGFATACNEGMAVGAAPYVLFLNPDARIPEEALRTLVGALERDERVGAVAPRIEYPDGGLAHSLRRFPSLGATYAQALFLHRVFPRAAWTTEIVKDDGAYAAPQSPDWVSGACILVRRSAMERIGGWDERFFLYCEDTDLCRRLRAAGLDIRFEPRAVALHLEGASSDRSLTLRLLAESRLRYAAKHGSRVRALAERLGLILWSATHVLVSSGGRSDRLGHARALGALLRPGPDGRPPRPSHQPS
jgi:N-acetylglucosaminyl-diphospho-decaprenol L-rhamnosyltransferase